jgi:hypothetical protein
MPMIRMEQPDKRAREARDTIDPPADRNRASKKMKVSEPEAVIIPPFIAIKSREPTMNPFLNTQRKFVPYEHPRIYSLSTTQPVTDQGMPSLE